MPESKPRKKDTYTPPKRKDAVKIGSPRWVAPLMIAFFLLGLLWIVAYYIAPEAPIMKDLTYWNVVGGFVLIGCGFIVATKWK